MEKEPIIPFPTLQLLLGKAGVIPTIDTISISHPHDGGKTISVGGEALILARNIRIKHSRLTGNPYGSLGFTERVLSIRFRAFSLNGSTETRPLWWIDYWDPLHKQNTEQGPSPGDYLAFDKRFMSLLAMYKLTGLVLPMKLLAHRLSKMYFFIPHSSEDTTIPLDSDAFLFKVHKGGFFSQVKYNRMPLFEPNTNNTAIHTTLQEEGRGIFNMLLAGKAPAILDIGTLTIHLSTVSQRRRNRASRLAHPTLGLILNRTSTDMRFVRVH